MAKLNREAKMRERRLDKQARKDARKLAASQPPVDPADALTTEDGEPAAADERDQLVEALAD